MKYVYFPILILIFLDSSGVELFYTPKLRPYAEDIFQTGDAAIFIPPHTKEHKVPGVCSEQCSKQAFEKPFNISSIILHMHGTGRFSYLIMARIRPTFLPLPLPNKLKNSVYRTTNVGQTVQRWEVAETAGRGQALPLRSTGHTPIRRQSNRVQAR